MKPSRIAPLALVMLMTACSQPPTPVQSTEGLGEGIAAIASPSSLPPTPTPTIPSLPPTPTPLSPTPLTQTYRDPQGRFEISFPQGYRHRRIWSDRNPQEATGILFLAPDRDFGGSVEFTSAQGKTLTLNQLEAELKKYYTSLLKDVSWEGSEPQPEGSLRLDWQGTNPEGNRLDGVSFIEQRGDTIFVLNLYGINQPYQAHGGDAKAIVSSYRVGRS